MVELSEPVFAHLVNLFEPSCKQLKLNVYEVLDLLCSELATPPLTSSVRVNTLKYSMLEATGLMIKLCREWSAPPIISTHPDIHDVLLIKAGSGPARVGVVPNCKPVIVDSLCGLAVLRGANVYSPGVLGALRDVSIGDTVSVLADKNGLCRRGLVTPFNGPTVHVGNGVACQTRRDWFSPSAQNSGLAIKMTQPLYTAPSLNETSLSDVAFAQNLPSLIASHVLAPSPVDNILDMCAAPGGKATHVATLMNNQGLVIALDRSAAKLKTLQHHVNRFGLTNICCHTFDSTRCCSSDVSAVTDLFSQPPPYSPCSFDKILLDAPCSGFGQRPQFNYSATLKDFISYPSYQRKLITQAVRLLKPGGILLYSTCSLSPEENECQIHWLLSTFEDMVLVSQVPNCGYPGLIGYGLNDDQCQLVQRFGPVKWSQTMMAAATTRRHETAPNLDTIGFFVAKMQKKSH